MSATLLAKSLILSWNPGYGSTCIASCVLDSALRAYLRNAERHALRAVTCDARRQGRILVAQVAQCLEVRLGRLVACRPLEEDVHIAIYPVRDDRNEGAVGDVDTHGVHQPRDEQISAAWYCEEVHDGGGRLARRGEFEERRWELALAKTRYIRVDWFEMCCRVAFEQNIVNICSADMANGELLLSEYPRLDANIDNIALVIESRLGDERDEERRPRPVSSTLVIENGLERANRNDVEGGYAVANANIRHGFLFWIITYFPTIPSESAVSMNISKLCNVNVFAMNCLPFLSYCRSSHRRCRSQCNARLPHMHTTERTRAFCL